MDFFADKVSVNHEINHNPEDVGTIKVYVSILLSEDSIIDNPSVLEFSLPAKEILDSFTRYRWDQLNCLENDERLNCVQVGFGRRKLNSLVVEIIFTNFTYYPNYYPTCAFVFYVTFKSMIPTRIEHYISFEETTIFEEDMQVLLIPASKVMVASLSTEVYTKTASSSDMCTICLDQFKVGERVVTLPCGHEFDHSCILEWFCNNHVCPLCRFELPC